MVCLIVFQAEKRQQMRQAGQRWTAFFRGESGFRGQQHHSLGITTGLVRRNNGGSMGEQEWIIKYLLLLSY